MRTNDNAESTSGCTATLVIDLRSRMKGSKAPVARRTKARRFSSTVHIFPLRAGHAAHRVRNFDDPARDRYATHNLPDISHRFTSIAFLSTRRGLIIGATACYALIIFNLVYGLTSLSRDASQEVPVAAHADDLKLAEVTPGDARSPLGIGVFSGSCITDACAQQEARQRSFRSAGAIPRSIKGW